MSVFVAALPTPFNGDLSVDAGAVRALVSFCRERGVSRFVVGGTTGEFVSLSVLERRLLTMAVIDAGADLVFHNISSCSEAEVVALSNDILADNIRPLLMLPWFFREVSKEGALAFVARTAPKSSTGLYLYNYPAMNGFDITPEFIRLAKRETSITGIKDSGVKYAHVKRLATEDPDLEVFSGTELHASDVLKDGLAGVVTGGAIPVLGMVSSMFNPGLPRVASSGARRSQSRLSQWNATCNRAAPNGILALKVALSMMIDGFPTVCRPPLKGPVNAHLIRAKLNALGLV